MTEHTRRHPVAGIDVETCVGCNATICKVCQPGRIVRCVLSGRHCSDCRETCIACSTQAVRPAPAPWGVTR